MASSSSASSSVSGAKALAPAGSTEEERKFGLLSRWAVKINYMCLDILKMGGQSTRDSQAELARVDLDDFKTVFDAAGRILNHFGTSGTKVLGNPPAQR